MRVSKSDAICGVPAPAARQLMRAYYDERPAEVACDVLGVSQNAALERLRAFEAAGYIERAKWTGGTDGGWWATTIKGNALAQASFGKPVSRTTADRLLAGVIERARAYNADPERLLTVARVAVFGSYLDPAADRLGDLDLAVSTVRRQASGQRHVDRVLAYARASGRCFGTFEERLFWPERELRMLLKNRSTAISITDEEVSRITDRFRVVYTVSDDPGAILV
jgi:predicted nucleotidyltransferase